MRAITLSACFYVLRCLLGEDAPATAGILRPLTLITEPGSIVDASPPAAVAGGNVETSQRIVDVLLRALAKAIPDRVPAASAGTMSNLTIGGVDPRTGQPFTYYETTAGGMGARPGLDGILGRADAYDQLAEYAGGGTGVCVSVSGEAVWVSRGSGGAGSIRGGDGLGEGVGDAARCGGNAAGGSATGSGRMGWRVEGKARRGVGVAWMAKTRHLRGKCSTG